MIRLGFLLAVARSPESTGNYGEMIVSSLFQTKRFKKPNYYLVNNLYFEYKNTTYQIDHVVICHQGIFCIETKHIKGRIVGYTNKSDWVVYNGNRKFNLYNPVYQNHSHIEALDNFLEHKYDIHSIVVFTNNNKPVVDDASVVNFTELADYILAQPNDELFVDGLIKGIYDLLAEYKKNCKITKSKHLENIKK